MSSIQQAISALHNGQLIVFPTETVYGIAADFSQPSAMDKLFDAKARDSQKPVAYFIHHFSQLEQLIIEIPPLAKQLANTFWPGPLTLVLPNSTGSYTGFRMPDHPIALDILRQFDGVLAVTSANKSGEPDALTVEETKISFGNKVTVYLDDGKVAGTIPSTVVRVDKENTLTILREGSISQETILSGEKK